MRFGWLSDIRFAPQVRRFFLVLTPLSVVAVAGCSHPVVVEPAEYAADPVCASVMLAAPEEVGGMAMRATTSQATAAWGESPEIIQRCGVEPPGPSEIPCTSVETSGGTVDWLIEEKDGNWVATSFGRSPAVEVLIPTIRADEAVGELLATFSPAAALAPHNNVECR